MATRLSTSDSIQQWVDKINAALDLETVDGSFRVEQTTFSDTNLTVTSGKVRSGTSILDIPGKTMTLGTSNTFLVGVDTVNEILTFYTQGSEPATDFIPLYVVSTNNVNVTGVQDARTWAFDDTGVADQAVTSHEGKADPHSQYGYVFDTVADMKSATFLEVAQKVRTLGYYAPGDGGGNDYEIVAAGTDTDDGGSFIDLAGSGLQAKGLFPDGRVRGKQFGVVADGVTDDSSKVNAALQLGVVHVSGNIAITEVTIPGGAGLVAEGTCRLICNNTPGRTNIQIAHGASPDLTTKVHGIEFVAQSNGGTCIATEVGSFYSTFSRYSFENLTFKGETLGASSSVWQYVEGWEKCLSIGDCWLARVNRMSVFGTYNIEADQAGSPDDVGIFLGGDASVRAVRITGYQSSDCKYPLEISDGVTSVFMSDFDLVRSHTGVRSTHISNSGELQLNQGYLNVQYVGIEARQRSWSFINGVNVTRHPSGFDHSAEWRALDLGPDLNDFSISNMRLLDAGNWVNVGTRTGVKMDDCLRGKVSGITIDAANGALDFGFDLVNSLDNVFENCVFDDVDVFWNFGAGCSDISTGNYEYRGAVSDVFQFDASITSTAVANSFSLKGFHLDAVTTDASRYPQVRLKRPAREWTIQNASNDNLIIRDVTSGENRMLFSDGAATISSGGKFKPTVDNTYDLGDASFRWGQVYAGSGTINTSDGRHKQQVRGLTDAEQRVAQALKGKVRAFKFNDAVERKGDGARIHVGVIAQEVADAFASEGLDARQYGILCYDQWDEQLEERDDEGRLVQAGLPAGDRYGVRYEELLAFIISAM